MVRIHRVSYFDLLQNKRLKIQIDRIGTDQHQLWRLWRPCDELLGRGRVPPVRFASLL
jgi:hypothetical protein